MYKFYAVKRSTVLRMESDEWEKLINAEYRERTGTLIKSMKDILAKIKKGKGGKKKDVCDFCGVSDESVGISGCGHEAHADIKICRVCDIDGDNYNGWCDE